MATPRPDSRTVVTFAVAPLVVSLGLPAASSAAQDRAPLTLMRSLFAVDVEAIRTSLVEGVVLGLLVAWTGLRALDFDADGRRPPRLRRRRRR